MDANIKKNILRIVKMLILILIIFSLTLINNNYREKESIITSAQPLSNKKIGWGIKRNDNHEQPDLGSTNKSILEKYNGICMGNNEKKYVYLTFDEGYEAGYTEKILEVLKQNDVKAAFFLTAHYVNTKPELVQKMIDEGHIIGNHF